MAVQINPKSAMQFSIMSICLRIIQIVVFRADNRFTY